VQQQSDRCAQVQAAQGFDTDLLALHPLHGLLGQHPIHPYQTGGNRQFGLTA